MFNDWHWIPRRTSAQQRRFDSWLADVIDAITGDNWWIDRDALRKKLPVN
jgi:hypothetical protein